MTVKAGQAITATADRRLAEAELHGVRSDSCPAAEPEGHSPTAAPHELRALRQSALAIPAIVQGSTATATGLAANRRLTTILRSLTQGSSSKASIPEPAGLGEAEVAASRAHHTPQLR
jgi:hypothetical protein